MPRKARIKPSTDLISEEIVKQYVDSFYCFVLFEYFRIQSFRPLRLFISKQKKKGNSVCA
jgi:hypothetical protein